MKRVRYVVGLAAGAVIAWACASFDEAKDAPTGGTDGGGSDANANADADAGGDGGPTCAPEQIGTAQHCGRCGRDCGAGKCVAGECEAYKVQPVAFPWYLAVDGTDVFWTSPKGLGGPGGVARAPKLGGAAAIPVWDGEEAFDVEVLGDVLLVTELDLDLDPGGIHRMQKDGSGRERLDDVAVEIAVHGAKAYAVTTSRNGSTNRVLEIAATGPVRQLADLETTRNNQEGVAADDTNLYFGDHQVDGRIDRIALASPTDAGVAQPFLGTAPSPRRLAVDDAFVYWIADAVQGVYRSPKGVGMPERIATTDAIFGRVISDGRYLYVTVQAERKVLRMDRDGANVRTILDGIESPTGLTQDDTAIYFGSHAPDGGIWRMVK